MVLAVVLLVLSQARKGKAFAVLVLVILRLRAAIGSCANLEGVDAVGEEVGSRLVRLANISFLCLSSIALFDILAVPRGCHCCSHVWRVAQLSLFVLEICIVCRVGMVTCLTTPKVTVTIGHVVRGRVRRNSQRVVAVVVLTGLRYTTGDAEALRAHFGRVKAGLEAKFALI